MRRFTAVVPGLLIVVALFAAFQRFDPGENAPGSAAGRQVDEPVADAARTTAASLSDADTPIDQSQRPSIPAESTADAAELPASRPRLDVAYQDLLSRLMAVPRMYEQERGGCRTPVYYMIEMELEDRDPDWAPDMELELRKLWLAADHEPFELAAQCHATICRVVAYTDDDIVPELRNGLQRHLFSTFYRTDLTRAIDLPGSYHSRELSVWVFRNKRRDWADEASCKYIAEYPPEITAQMDLEANATTQDCLRSSDYLLCLAENGFGCNLIVHFEDTPYLCRKDAPPGHFEALWTPEDDGYSGRIHWIKDPDNQEDNAGI